MLDINIFLVSYFPFRLLVWITLFSIFFTDWDMPLQVRGWLIFRNVMTTDSTCNQAIIHVNSVRCFAFNCLHGSYYSSFAQPKMISVILSDDIVLQVKMSIEILPLPMSVSCFENISLYRP